MTASHPPARRFRAGRSRARRARAGRAAARREPARDARDRRRAHRRGDRGPGHGRPGPPTDHPVRGGGRPRRRHGPVSWRAIGSRCRSSHARATAGRSVASRRARCRRDGCPARRCARPRRCSVPSAPRSRSRSSPSARSTCRISTRPRTFVAQPAAAVDPGALKREVFGFLPYWELTDSSTRLDWEKLSTVAYFGVGALGNGTLQKRNSDGSTTVGWSGWTSSKMTAVIDAAHASGARVVLTVQSFAWSSTGVTRQKALLGSPGNRLDPRPPDRGRRARPRRRRRQPRLRTDRLDLRRRVHRRSSGRSAPSSTRSPAATS